MKRLHGAFLVTAAVVFVVLLVVPATRIIVRNQLAFAAGMGNELQGFDFDQRAVARRVPNDFDAQLAAAIEGRIRRNAGVSVDFHEVQMRRLESLGGRFGGNPSLDANILRMDSMKLHLRRTEPFLLDGAPIPKNYDAQVSRPTSGSISEYLRRAADGERLDPSNAYFPFTAAVGLFASGRDSEALATLHRASLKPEWREYYMDEAKGEWKLSDLANGTAVGLVHMTDLMAILLPQYANLRTASRVAVYHAVALEESGQTSRGLAIRRDVLRLGSLMRSQADSLIGCLVGADIADEAAIRPGGAPPEPLLAVASASSREAATEQREQRFVGYLRSIGPAKTVNAVEAEFDADRSVRRVAAANDRGGDPFFNDKISLARDWAWDGIAIDAAFWFLVFAVLALIGRRLVGSRTPFISIRSIVIWGLLTAAAAALSYAAAFRQAAAFTGAFDPFVAHDVLVPGMPRGVVATVLALLPVFALALGSIIVMAVRARPIIPAFVRGCAVGVLTSVVVYAFIVIGTVRDDRRLDDHVTRVGVGPAAMMSSATVEWPGPTDLSSLSRS